MHRALWTIQAAKKAEKPMWKPRATHEPQKERTEPRPAPSWLQCKREEFMGVVQGFKSLCTVLAACAISIPVAAQVQPQTQTSGAPEI